MPTPTVSPATTPQVATPRVAAATEAERRDQLFVNQDPAIPPLNFSRPLSEAPMFCVDRGCVRTNLGTLDMVRNTNHYSLFYAHPDLCFWHQPKPRRPQGCGTDLIHYAGRTIRCRGGANKCVDCAHKIIPTVNTRTLPDVPDDYQPTKLRR